MMKGKKKLVMGLSFCMGALLFVTTAFADIASKSGYEQLKESIKYTAENCNQGLKSYTTNNSISFKNNDKEIMYSNSITKVDLSNSIKESTGETIFPGNKKETSYYYNDKNKLITYASDNDTYYITENYKKSNNIKVVDNNPFKEESFKDIERIFDAVIGNLKEHVVVEENPDGSKNFSGSLSEVQIPALINAASSFLFKRYNEDNGRDVRFVLPKKLQDIYVKKVSGKASTNKAGILESIFGTVVLGGKDGDGNVQEFTMDILVKLYDIDSTIVNEPDFTGKKVERNVAKDTQGITKKYIGKWKNDIIKEENDQFIKAGERMLEITAVDDKFVYGKYSESYNEAYSANTNNISSFDFKAEIKNEYSAEFDYTMPSGTVQKGFININPGRIYFNFDSYKYRMGFVMDDTFTKVFE